MLRKIFLAVVGVVFIGAQIALLAPHTVRADPAGSAINPGRRLPNRQTTTTAAIASAASQIPSTAGLVIINSAPAGSTTLTSNPQISGGVDGQTLMVVNGTGSAIVIQNTNGVSAEENIQLQVATFGYSSAVGSWFLISSAAAVDVNWGLASTANLAATKVIGQTTYNQAALLDTGSNITINVAGVGTGPLVLKVCDNGSTCGAGHIYLTCTVTGADCTAVAGTVSACAVTTGYVPPGTTLTASVTTACGTTDPAYNLTVHGVRLM